MSWRVSLRSVFLVVLGAGCSSVDPVEATSDAGAFPAEPLMTLHTEAGALGLEVRTSPSQPPSRGTAAVEYTVTDASGAPVSGLTVLVEPWMPAMGHGASVEPKVSEEGQGKYVAEGVELTMPGRWELRTTFSGAASDHATILFDVP